jgi:hypothetical protein
MCANDRLDKLFELWRERVMRCQCLKIGCGVKKLGKYESNCEYTLCILKIKLEIRQHETIMIVYLIRQQQSQALALIEE